MTRDRERIKWVCDRVTVVKRRAFLARAGLAAVASGSLAGCLGGLGVGVDSDGSAAGDSRVETTAPAATESDAATPTATNSLAASGSPATICSAPVRRYSGIYAIDAPAFADGWSGFDLAEEYRTATDDSGELVADHTVVGIEADGAARAYPLEVLTSHEIVNDEFGGPLLVTYCPICRSGMVAERVVDGRATTFAVSGQLWQPEGIRVAAAEETNRTFGAERSGGESVAVRASGNLVMYDLATGSYWSQILAQAICGPATGD
ncbi:MAG: DUF3179 domain-containing (seleno)protein, partial [Halobaculum sp.]